MLGERYTSWPWKFKELHNIIFWSGICPFIICVFVVSPGAAAIALLSTEARRSISPTTAAVVAVVVR